MVQHQGEVLYETHGIKIIDCDICGFIHIDPLPSIDDLKELYQEVYHDLNKTQHIQRQEEDREWWRLTYGDRYDNFEKLLNTKGLVVDIGSGAGMFLEVGSQLGWETLGVEPSRHAAQYSRDKNQRVIESFFDESCLQQLPLADVVHMSNVLEHVINPAEMIELALKILKPGGLFVVSVPNDFNPLQKTYVLDQKKHPWWIVPHHHINYFEFESLKKLLSRFQLSTILEDTSFPMELFLLMGDDYIDDDSLGRECHRRRKKFDLAFANVEMKQIRAMFYQSLAAVGIGREVILYATKELS